jgi:hypothetical protein
MLSDSDIDKFINIYEKCFHKKLSRKVAYEKSVKFLNLFRAVFGIVKNK